MEPLAGSIACLLSLFLPCGQALKEVWRCEMRRRLRAGVLYWGNGLAIMKGAAPLKRNTLFMEIEMTSFSRDIIFRRCGS